MNKYKFFIQVILIVSLLGSKSLYSQSNSTRIQLNNKNITEVPDSIFQLSKLNYLDLGCGWISKPINEEKPIIENANAIIQLPNKFNRLPHLEVLDLSCNNIQDLPSSFRKLKNLKALNLSYNNGFNLLKNLPIISSLPKLQVLNLIGVPEALNNKKEIIKTFATIKNIYFTWDDLPIHE